MVLVAGPASDKKVHTSKVVVLVVVTLVRSTAVPR